MRQKWVLLITISYIVTAALSIPLNTTQPSQGSEISPVNSVNSEDKSKSSPALAGSDNSEKDSKINNESNDTVNKAITEGDKIEQDNISKASSSDGSEAASAQPDVDRKNHSSKSTVQINDSGAAPPETPAANRNTSNENEQVIGDSGDDETLSEAGDNTSVDKTDGNDTNAEGQTTGSGSESGKSSVVDPKDNSNLTDGSTVKETDGGKANNTVDESAKLEKPETPSTDGDTNSENEDPSPKEQGVSDNAAANGIDDNKSSKSPSENNKSSFAPDQGGEKEVTVPADQEDVDDSQQLTQKQNVNPADGDDFETYYQDESKYDSKSSMDGSVPQAGPSYDDTDVEEPVRAGDRRQYEDDKQTFISSGGQNQKMGGQFTDDEDSHFFAYFLTIMVTAIIFYLVFHNKQRIIALIIEGRAPRNGRGRRSSSRAKYHKLDNNLEEAITATKGSKYDGLY